MAGSLFGCSHTATPLKDSGALDWLTGCWQLEDQSVEETWAKSRQGDQLFGYSVSTKDAQRVFFEQLRIDLQNSRATLNAYPRGIGPTKFEGTVTNKPSIEFINELNDYPQRIRYERIDNRLVAEISLIDKSKPANWDYRRCE